MYLKYSVVESYLLAPNEEDYEHYNTMMFKYAQNEASNSDAMPKENSGESASNMPKADQSHLKLKRKKTCCYIRTRRMKFQTKWKLLKMMMKKTLPPTQIVKVEEPTTQVLNLSVSEYVPPLQKNQHIMQSDVRQAPSIFQGAVFNNCTINFQMSSNQ